MTAASDTTPTAPARRRRTRAVLIGAGAVLVIGSGAAFAWWTTTGSGTGQAEAGTTSEVTIAQVGTVTGLYPGGPAQDLQVTITNPGASAVQVMAVTAEVSPDPTVVVDDPADTNGCTAVDFTVTGREITPTPISPGGTSAPITIGTLAMNNLNENQNDCKGVTVPLKFTVPGSGVGG